MTRFTTLFVLTLLTVKIGFSQVRLEPKQMFLNYNGAAIGSSDFVISRQNGFAGMYTHVNNHLDGKPFYGYAVAGDIRSFTYYNSPDNTWRLNLSSKDKLIIGIDTSQIKTDFHVWNNLVTHSSTSPFFTIDSDQQSIMVNTQTPFNSFTDFTLRSKSSDFGGMYIDVPNGTTGKPFYGYAVNGIEKAFTFYDAEDATWKLFIDNVNDYKIEASANFIKLDGPTGINATSSFNSLTNFTIDGKSDQNTFNGMYINSQNNSTGKPFYGYGLQGTDYAFHYFDAADLRWKLFVVNPSFSNGTNILEASSEEIFIDGLLRLYPTDGSTATQGTIYYHSGSFWGVTSSGVKRLDNVSGSSARVASATSKEYQDLKVENERLKQELDQITARLNQLEANLTKLVKD